VSAFWSLHLTKSFSIRFSITYKTSKSQTIQMKIFLSFLNVLSRTLMYSCIYFYEKWFKFCWSICSNRKIAFQICFVWEVNKNDIHFKLKVSLNLFSTNNKALHLDDLTPKIIWCTSRKLVFKFILYEDNFRYIRTIHQYKRIFLAFELSLMKAESCDGTCFCQYIRKKSCESQQELITYAFMIYELNCFKVNNSLNF